MVVYLIGAGPGDADLITLKAVKALNKADVVLYDYLANEEILAHAPETAEKIFNQLGIINPKLKTWDSIKNESYEIGTKVIEKGEPLFVRLDKDEEVEYIKNHMK